MRRSLENQDRRCSNTVFVAWTKCTPKFNQSGSKIKRKTTFPDSDTEMRDPCLGCQSRSRTLSLGPVKTSRIDFTIQNVEPSRMRSNSPVLRFQICNRCCSAKGEAIAQDKAQTMNSASSGDEIKHPTSHVT